MDSAQEQPRNGIRGLKHWRFDLMAGLQVALVSVPLPLGIAVAFRALPVTGVVSTIITGLVFPFLGGVYVTISDPAAAPRLLGADLNERVLALDGCDVELYADVMLLCRPAQELEATSGTAAWFAFAEGFAALRGAAAAAPWS